MLASSAFAANPRDLIIRAKSSFEAEDEGRGARRSAAEFGRFEEAQRALVARQNTMMALGRLDLSKPPANASPNAPETVPPAQAPDDLLPPVDQAEFDDVRDLDPVEGAKKPIIEYQMGPLLGLLSMGAQLYDRSTELGQALLAAAKDIFQNTARKRIDALWMETPAAHLSAVLSQSRHILELAKKVLEFACATALEAAHYFSQAGVDQARMDEFLVFVQAQSEIPLGSHVNIPFMERGGLEINEDYWPVEYRYDEERAALFAKGREKIGRTNAAISALSTIHPLSPGAYYRWQQQEAAEHQERMNAAMAVAQAILPEVDLTASFGTIWIENDSVVYQDELGNTIEAFRSGSTSVSYDYQGTLNADMKAWLSEYSWRQKEIVYTDYGSVVAEQVYDRGRVDARFADFMAYARTKNLQDEDPRFWKYNWNIFRNLKVQKIIEKGMPTLWHFRDVATDELLAAVIIPGSEVLPENIRPMNLDSPTRIIETYIDAKLVNVEVQDILTSAAVFIRPQASGDPLDYNSTTGAVVNGNVSDLSDPSPKFQFTMGQGIMRSFTNTQNSGLLESFINELVPGSQSIIDKVKRIAATLNGLMTAPTFQEARPVAELSAQIRKDFGVIGQQQVDDAIKLFVGKYGVVPDVEIVAQSSDSFNLSILGLVNVKVSDESTVAFKGNMPTNTRAKIKFNLFTGKIESAEYSIKSISGSVASTVYAGGDLSGMTELTSFDQIFQGGGKGEYNWDVDTNLSSREQLVTHAKLNSSGILMRSVSLGHELIAGAASHGWRFELSFDQRKAAAAGLAAISVLIIMASAYFMGQASFLGATGMAGIVGLAHVLSAAQSELGEFI